MMCKRKRIILIATKAGLGGAQKYIRDLRGCLDKEKYEVLIITGREGEDFDSDIRLKWLSNSYKPLFLFLPDWLAIWEMYKAFKKEKPDVIHLNSSKAGIVGTIAGKLAGVPKIIFTAHGWVFQDGTLSWIRKRFYIWLHRLVARWQTKIINISKADREAALENKIALLDKMKMISIGIKIDDFEREVFNKNKAREEIKKRLGSGFKERSGKEWIGSLGRLVKEKNYELLARATKELDYNFFIIGEGPEEKKIRQAALGDNFHLVKPKKEDGRLIKAFDVFVLSSLKEGMPYTLIEAMMAKVPVVVSRVGGMPEVVEGERGYMFKNGDEQGLKGEIEKALEYKEETKKRVELAYEFMKENMNLDKKIKEIEGVYEED